MVEFDNNSSAMTVSNSASGDASVSSGQVAAPLPVPVKKKRNLPGMPDPEAEVIALSPKTLMATNRFVCEICSKGFQRDQNLQLHRRGHNLPWKLRQRTGKEPRKRVYVCPEPSCIHHDPSRALGDLTGIKKHFSRKHGEKKWKCEKCSKKYAVQSDWKAHSKTCGTREYRCDCGTLFSRRDSFITHRAFCDALAEENAKAGTGTAVASSVTEEENGTIVAVAAAEEAAPLPLCAAAPPEQQEPEKNPVGMQYLPPASIAVGGGNNSSTNSSSSSSTASIFANLFASAPAAHGASFSDMISNMSRSERPVAADVPSLCLAGPGSLFSQRQQFAPAPVPAPALPSPHMSATALLQKAAQMGATASNGSFLRGFGLASSSSGHQESRESGMQWHQQPPHQQPESEPPMLSAALGLGLSYQHEMMGSSSLFGPKPSATLDFLGLGMRPGGSGSGGLSALITSMGSGDLDEVDAASPTGQFRGGSSSTGRGWESERKPAVL